MITITGINKKLSDKFSLNDITFKLDKGVYGLLGLNGAGKTTLLRCITGLINVDSGSIQVEGDVGYLSQKFGLFSTMKADDALMYMADLKGVPEEERAKQIDQVLQLVNLQDHAKKRVGKLSGGMVRRLGIAQAFLGKSENLIFDEPTAGLDPEERLRFKSIIKNQTSEKTVLISTHIVEDIEGLCEKVIVLKEGVLRFFGTIQEACALVERNVIEIPKERVADFDIIAIVSEETRNGIIMVRALVKKQQVENLVVPTLQDAFLYLSKT